MRQFKRKEREVAAIEVKSENVSDITAMCGGQLVEEIDPENGTKFLGVNVPTLDGVKRASQGDYIVREDGFFSVVKASTFRHMFEEV